MCSSLKNVIVHLPLLLISLLCFNGSEAYNLTVKTDNGYVTGYEETGKNVNYFAFKGIPFAEPPVGDLRFKDPVPVKSWEGIKEANAFAEECVQISVESNEVSGSEDCLYLNIYVPKTDKDNQDLSLPVMVWIPAGAFQIGNSKSDPSYLMEKPVIIVYIAYRLNVFGFYSTLDENAYGNAGLKDQVVALKWIKDNIGYFGGNADKITIAGGSSGGQSVDYHLVSPKSFGLFNQAISESGSTLSQYSVARDPVERAYKLGQTLNLTFSNTAELTEALKEVDYVTLREVSYTLGQMTFVPTIEVDNDDAFLSRSSYEILELGEFNKVPYLVGYNTEEGTAALDQVYTIAETPKIIIPDGLNIDWDSETADEVLELVTEQYFPNYSYDNFTNDIVYLSQSYFIRGIRKTVEFYSKYSTAVYFYKFTYVSDEGTSSGVLGGPGHGDNVKFLWYTSNLTSEHDILTKNRLVTMWTNFAIYGNPTPEEDELLGNVIWPEASGDEKGGNIYYLDIGESLVPGKNPDNEDYLFWKELFEKYAVGTIYVY